MSKLLVELTGQVEVPREDDNPVPTCREETVRFYSFRGNMKRGHSLQITIGNESYIQLDNESVKELIKFLQENYL